MVAIPTNLTPAQLLDLFKQLEDGLWDLRIGKYALLAGFTLGVYDHILTFPREVKHIWRAKQWSAPRAIFLFTRYSFYPLMIVHIFDNLGPARPDGFCLRWVFANTYWTYVMYSMMHWLVALRVYAYWGRSQNVFIMFITLWSLAFIGTTVEATYWLVKYVKPSAIYDPLLKVCTASAPAWIPIINISFLLLEAPAFCLTAYKYRQDAKRVLHTTLINTLMQDGLIYFFIVVALTTGTALFMYFAPLAMSGVPRFLTIGIVDVTVSRLVLSLREAAGKTGTNMSTSSDARPSNGATAYSSYQRRGKSEEKGNNYALDTIGETTFVQPVPNDLLPDQTIVIGNPYAYNWDRDSDTV